MLKLFNPFDRNQNQQSNAPERFPPTDKGFALFFGILTSSAGAVLFNQYFYPGKPPSYTPEVKPIIREQPNSNEAKKTTLAELAGILKIARNTPNNSPIVIPGMDCIQGTPTRTDCTSANKSPNNDQFQIGRDNNNIEVIKAKGSEEPIFPIYPSGSNSSLRYTPFNTPFAAGIIDANGLSTGARDSITGKPMQSIPNVTMEFTFDRNTKTAVSGPGSEKEKFDELIAALKIK
jgi:hypothetical protein